MSANLVWLCILLVVTAAALLLRRRHLSVRPAPDSAPAPADLARPEQPTTAAQPPLSVMD